MKIPVLITASLDSERLPRKYLLDLGGRTVIEHIIQRSNYFGFDTIACLPKGEEWPKLPCEVYYGSNERDERVMECAIDKNIERFHNLDGDDPFFSREDLIDNFTCLWSGPYAKVEASIYSQSGPGCCGSSYNRKSSGDAIATQPEPEGRPWPVRLTLDYEEDYQLLCAINRMCGGFMAPRWAIDRIFTNNPDLHKINWFRTAEWKDRQLAEANP